MERAKNKNIIDFEPRQDADDLSNLAVVIRHSDECKIAIGALGEFSKNFLVTDEQREELLQRVMEIVMIDSKDVFLQGYDLGLKIAKWHYAEETENE